VVNGVRSWARSRDSKTTWKTWKTRAKARVFVCTAVYLHLHINRNNAHHGWVMKRLLLVALILLSTCAYAAPKLEKLGQFKEGSDQLQKALAAEGYRVFLPNTLACCDIWLAKSIGTKKKVVAGANYPELHESEFVGVITFPKGSGGDFRGQTIRSGSYTMRYELLPADGNHMGVAPYPDFVLLIPIANDPDPAATFDFGKMVELSTKASGTGHPATFEMMPAAESDDSMVRQTDDGWIVFQAAIPIEGGKTLKIAFVVKGSAE
jgi:hypothetical protein